MSLHYIIDGYNIINHTTFPSTHKKIEDKPCSLLNFIESKKLCGSTKNKVTLVFDGFPKEPGLRYDDSRFNIIFSRDRSADERIKNLIENSQNNKALVVVSDDKEIIYFAKVCRVKTISVEEFICPASKVNRKEKELLKQELSYSQIEAINKELRKIWQIS